MKVDSGTQFGPYVVGERVGSSVSGEWFEASEAALDRPVSVLVTPLPTDEEAAAALRERARRLAGATDAWLLPVYGQGEHGNALWLATRRVEGRPLSQIGPMDVERAARLASQVARQLAAREDAGIAPNDLDTDDIVVEGDGAQERAWLLPDPTRGVSQDASTAVQSLVRLVDGRVGRPLLDDASSDARTLADQLAPLSVKRSRRPVWIGAGVGVALLAGIAALLAVVLIGDSGSSDSNAPAASTSAPIRLGATVTALTADDSSVWAATPAGELIRVDAQTETVIGAPLKVLPEDAYVDLLADGGSVWAGGPGLLLRLESSTGRVLERKQLGSRAVSGLAAANGSLWVTLNEGTSAPAKLVSFRAGSDREVAQGPSFGVFPVPVTAREGNVWALGGDASLTRVDSDGDLETIALASQAGFPTEHDGRIWVPTRNERTLVVVDPARMAIERVLHFDAEPVRVAAGAGSVWVLTQNPSLIHRVDAATSRFLGAPVPAPTGASFIRFGAGSVWVDDPKGQALVRLTPTDPVPAARPVEEVGEVLRNGPVPKGIRVRVTALDPPFSIEVPDDGWLAEGITGGVAQFELMRYRRPGYNALGVSVSFANQVFGPSSRLVAVRTPNDFLRALRKNASLRITRVAPVTIGGRKGLRVRFSTTPKPPFPEVCRGSECVLLFPQRRGTFILLKGNEEFTVLRQGRGLLLIDATLGEHVEPMHVRQIRSLIDSIRFEG